MGTWVLSECGVRPLPRLYPKPTTGIPYSNSNRIATFKPITIRSSLSRMCRDKNWELKVSAPVSIQSVDEDEVDLTNEFNPGAPPSFTLADIRAAIPKHLCFKRCGCGFRDSSVDLESSAIQSEEVYLATSQFETSDDLLRSVRSFYYTKGYGLCIRDSRKGKHVTLQCDRGRSYKEPVETNRERSTTSRLINCPFQIVGKRRVDGAWAFTVKDLTHNHEPSTDMSGHASFRRLSPNKVKSVKEMTMSGIPPRQILSSLRQETPGLPANSRTIYNLKKKIRRDTLGNRPMINALFEELAKAGFSYDIVHNPDGRITRLFIAHPLSIKLAKHFSNTFVMDCTYKTNKYNMPLLDIIGVSCFNTTFYSGFVFLEKEDEENYVWSLSAFKKILGHDNLPSVIMTDRELALMNGIKNELQAATNLLCVWHIEKNVLANCKKYFGSDEEFDIFMGSWQNVVYSTTEAIFEYNWAEFELFYSNNKGPIEYIKNVWLPWKEKFVSVWTEKYLHFGTRTSSRVEGAHAKLKKYLQVSTCDFQEVKDTICLAVEHEFNEIKVTLASEKIKVLNVCNTPFFRELLYHVSHFALKEIFEQYKKTKAGTTGPCTGHFTSTMGLPCAHKIQHYVGHGMTLPLDLIHPHWRFDSLSLNLNDDYDGDDTIVKLLKEFYSKYQSWPLSKKESAVSMISNFVNESDTFFEPVIRRPKGRQPKVKKKKGTTSTTRDPSRFEYVESLQSHISSSSTSIFQINNEVTEEFGNMHHGNNLMDFGVSSDFSFNFTPSE